MGRNRVYGPATADVFPAEVAIIPPGVDPDSLPALSSRTPATQLPPGAQRLSRVRLVATRAGVFVFTDSPTRPGAQDRPVAMPLPIMRSTDATANLPRGVANATSTSEARLTTADGTTITWSRGSGCGCGSRLRSFNPYRDEATLTLPAPAPASDETP